MEFHHEHPYGPHIDRECRDNFRAPPVSLAGVSTITSTVGDYDLFYLTCKGAGHDCI
jgi:hypothetical protein